MNKPLVLSVLAVCVCVIVFVCSINRALFKKNGVFTNGRVTNVYSAVKGGIRIDYEFYHKGKKLKEVDCILSIARICINSITETSRLYILLIIQP
jgi:hypothetical protein